MAESVVKYLPAMNSPSSFPVVIIRRNVEPVIEPSGKASFAVTSKRSGVICVTVPAAGICTLDFFTACHHELVGSIRRRGDGVSTPRVMVTTATVPVQKNFGGPGNQPRQRS
jgi:hypothetical protein